MNYVRRASFNFSFTWDDKQLDRSTRKDNSHPIGRHEGRNGEIWIGRKFKRRESDSRFNCYSELEFLCMPLPTECRNTCRFESEFLAAINNTPIPSAKQTAPHIKSVDVWSVVLLYNKKRPKIERPTTAANSNEVGTLFTSLPPCEFKNAATARISI